MIIFCSCTDQNEVNETYVKDESVFEYRLKTVINNEGDTMIVVESGNPDHIELSPYDPNSCHLQFSPDIAKNSKYVLYLNDQLINELNFNSGDWTSKRYDYESLILFSIADYNAEKDLYSTQVFDPITGLVITETLADSSSEKTSFYDYYANGKTCSKRVFYDHSTGFAEFRDTTGNLIAREYWLHESVCGRIDYLDKQGHISKTLNYYSEEKNGDGSGELDSLVVLPKERLNGWKKFNYLHGQLHVNYKQDSLKALKIILWRDRNGLLLKDTLTYYDTFPNIQFADPEMFTDNQ